MIIILRRIVFFGTVFLSLLGVILMLIESDGTRAPEELKIAILSLIFLLGVMLIIVVAKRGLGG